MDEKDESDVQITNASYSVLNVVCPVSGVPVVGLKDPVRRLPFCTSFKLFTHF